MATKPLTQTTGRRKEAIARVRLVPGTGRFTVNGRTLEDYFPNKVHQQLVNEPDLVGALVTNDDRTFVVGVERHHPAS